jgi:RNA polymerase sigma-70 factor (ECF subfamily)
MVALLPRLRAFATALAGNRADADDLVQQACEKALGALDGFEPGTRLDSWMFRIMRNIHIDTFRRRRPQVPVDAPEIAARLAGEDGRQVSEARLAMADMRVIVARLPEDQRAVLMLVCVAGMKYREAAEILDMPIGTVMSRLSRARIAIAEAMDGGGPLSVRSNDPDGAAERAP